MTIKGKWSPNSRSTESLEREATKNPLEPPPPPIWTPKSAPSSPLPEKREFKSVNFESPVLSRKAPPKPQVTISVC